MSTLSRLWLGFAWIGLGMIHAALAVGTVPVAWAALVALGLGEIVWALILLIRESVAAPEAQLGAALVTGTFTVLMATVPGLVSGAGSAATLPLLPVLLAVLLQSIVVVITGGLLRRRRSARAARDSASTPFGGNLSDLPPTGRRRAASGGALAGLALVGALAVAGVVTPALAASHAGDTAVSHHGTTVSTDELPAYLQQGDGGHGH